MTNFTVLIKLGIFGIFFGIPIAIMSLNLIHSDMPQYVTGGYIGVAVLVCYSFALIYAILEKDSKCCPSPTCASSNSPPYLGERKCGGCGAPCKDCKEAMK